MVDDSADESIAADSVTAVQTAARWLLEAEALLVGSGAGMGVDAGLGTFRGTHAGVWPPLERHGLDYADVCQPRWFEEDPAFAWAFWGHCDRLYTQTQTHGGYDLVKQWADQVKHKAGAFCLTTNIDGHWRKAGWPERALLEKHGSCRLLQCSKPCSDEAWPPADGDVPPLAEECDDRAEEARLPLCPRCGAIARPNVLMFGDSQFAVGQHQLQLARYKDWLQGMRSKSKFQRRSLKGAARRDAPERSRGPLSGLVCVEIGAGVAVATVRREFERLCGFEGARLIRVNPEHTSLPKALACSGKAVCVPLGAHEALRAIDAVLCKLRDGDKLPLRVRASTASTMAGAEEADFGRLSSAEDDFFEPDVATSKQHCK
ncbi:unnamed protein product [Polarella glacialis]|uniref:Deacetylase sirtuin-type domain-containing protein n=1 Tax=Polarella glacialis TaxID=89957 RepID=A0A813KH71_POLGL|nr:unnamed protein product [Polarella glacialis]|mmetsp:Transcript_61358/g.99351  ORF Transcript_61358/g.99351 Transcript_61358/m.99351 type:complete len:374 (-) Transcript_61358:31-1152(-)